MAQDLQAEDNRLNRLFEKFSSEAKAVSIATVALIVSTLALLMAFMGLYDAIHVKASLESDERYTIEYLHVVERETRLLKLQIEQQRGALIAAGIDPDFHLKGEHD